MTDCERRARPKKKSKATIIVTARENGMKRENLRKSLKENINSDSFEVSGMSNAPLNGIAISCENEESCDKLINEIESKLPQDVVVTKPKKLRPRLKIIRLHDADEDNNRLVEILKKKNPCIANSELKVIKREEIRSKGNRIENLCNLIIEVSPEVHKEIMKTGKLKHEWEMVRVVDNIHVTRCFNCCGFNHKASSCSNVFSCGKCSEGHLSRECMNEVAKCINCIRANKRFQSAGHTKFLLDVNHSAWSKNCDSFKRKVEQCKNSINTID